MAGIGFALKSFHRQDTLSSVVASFGHAAVVAAGPWLFTILSLASITLVADQIVGLATLADFRAVIIYAFATSLVLSAPVTMVATRLVANALWLKQVDGIHALLLGAFAVCLALVAAGVVALIAYFRPPATIAIVFAASSLLAALIWIALAFSGAIRDYTGVTLSFLIGLFVSVLASIGAAIAGYHAPGMAAGFLIGLAVTFFGLTARIRMTFPDPVRDPIAGMRAIIDGLTNYWTLAVGALVGAIAVWIDKWIYWFSPVSETVASGFLHAPIYDSSMFIASLAVIPSLGAFVMKLETEFFERYQHYYGTIAGHGTLSQIEAARERLARYTLDHLTLITIVQAGISTILVLTAPIIIDVLGLQFRQIAILRYGAIGVVFHFIFIAAVSMLLFFDRRKLFLSLQVMFCVLNAGLTVLALQLGEEYYGTGYFLACFTASFFAYRLAEATFARLNFLTFIGNNPSVAAGTGRRTRRCQRLTQRLTRL
jgi:uncharacterized membrane protein